MSAAVQDPTTVEAFGKTPIGPFIFTTPTLKPNLTAEQFDRLQQAMVLVEESSFSDAARLLEQLEGELEIPDDKRGLKVFQGPFCSLALAADTRRGALVRELERRRVAGLIYSDRVPLTDQNRKDLLKVDEELAKVDKIRVDDVRGKARRAAPHFAAVRDLQARVAKDQQVRGERQWIKGALEETQALEQVRGEEVKIEIGAVRISTRDALLDMWDRARRTCEKVDGKPAMTRDQFHAGMQLRELWDHANPSDGLGSQLGKIEGGSRGPVNVAAMRALRAKQKAAAVAKLTAIFQAVEIAARGQDAPMILVQVAVYGRSIRGLTKAARRREQYTRTLRLALDVVASQLFKPVPTTLVEFETRATFCAFAEEQERLRRLAEAAAA